MLDEIIAGSTPHDPSELSYVIMQKIYSSIHQFHSTTQDSE